MEGTDEPLGGGPQEGAGAASAADEEELRRRVEDQLRRVRVQDLLLESVAGIVNLTARRIAKEDERDLEQARIGIEAVRAVVDLLEPEPGKAVRDALSELQVLFARETSADKAPEGGAEGEGEGGSGPDEDPPRGPSGGQGPGPTGPARGPRAGEPPPRLWTPPGAT
jgi:hypothetical protein